MILSQPFCQILSFLQTIYEYPIFSPPYEDWRNSPETLKQVRDDSYARCDEDGNYYRSSFGLHY